MAETRGRKSNEEKFGPIYEAVDNELHALLALVPQALRDLVLGAWREEEDREGRRRVYQQLPNIEAIKVLMDRTKGKPTQAIQHSGEIQHSGDLLGTLAVVDKLELLKLVQEDVLKELPSPETIDGEFAVVENGTTRVAD